VVEQQRREGRADVEKDGRMEMQGHAGILGVILDGPRVLEFYMMVLLLVCGKTDNRTDPWTNTERCWMTSYRPNNMVGCGQFNGWFWRCPNANASKQYQLARA